MKTYVPFNSNGYVRVKLTDTGRAVIQGHIDRRKEEYPKLNWQHLMPAEDADGWSEWQLWQLMQTFGRHVGNGMDLVFETAVEFIVEGDWQKQ